MLYLHYLKGIFQQWLRPTVNFKRETKAALVISHVKILQVLNSLDFLKYQK